MNACHRLTLGALPLLVLTGCLSSSGPAWLESNRIDMREYSNLRVIILPVEITPPYELEEGERRAIQDQVKNNLVNVFGLKSVVPLQMVERTRIYPYQLEELTDIGQLYAADAVAAISIFSLVRESPDPRSENNRVGMRVTFVDVANPSSSWAMSREYRSRRGFDTDSNRFDTSVRQDLVQVRDELRSQYGAGAGLKRTVTFGILGYGNPEEPRVTVNIPVLGSQFDGEQRVSQDEVKTEQSTVQFRILAEDVTGLVKTEIVNTKSDFETTLDYCLSKSDPDALPLRINESVTIPLKVGENRLEFTTYNRQNLQRVNVVTIRREAKEFVYTLGVGISQYESKAFGESPVNSGDLKRRFESRAASMGTLRDKVIFLENEEADRRGIEGALFGIGAQARHNDQGLGLFYFAGKVQANEEGVFLLAYDTEPNYLDVTGIDTEYVRRWCRGNCHTILDLCEADAETKIRLVAALPEAQISFDSCTPGQNKNADDLRDRLNSGMSAKEALQEVVKKKK